MLGEEQDFEIVPHFLRDRERGNCSDQDCDPYQREDDGDLQSPWKIEPRAAIINGPLRLINDRFVASAK